MLNEFKIAETDTFTSKMTNPKYAKIYKKIYDFVYPQLRENPFFGSNIKKLKGEFEGLYRYRVGGFRIFYKIENKQVLVIMVDIDDRKDAYK